MGATGGTAGSGGTDVDCDEPGATVWQDNGHCYYARNQGAGWPQHRDACESAGAHLVTITSQDEQSFVEVLGTGDRWIGFSRVGTNEFEWVTGENSAYDNWQQGEPNENGDACARIRDNGNWTDRPCDSQYAAICERE